MADRSLSAFATRLLTAVLPYHPPLQQGRSNNKRRGPIAPPLPPRIRALTLPVSASYSATAPTNPQRSSPFFTLLAYELRLQIYAHVLGSRIIHLGLETQDEARLAPYLRHFCCNTPQLDPVADQPWHGCWYPMSGRRKDPEQGLLGLLMTCQRVYSEAIATLYTRNTFHMRSLPTFLALPTLLLPARLSSLRTLVLVLEVADFPPRAGTQDYEDFNALWGALETMQGLRVCHVHVAATSRCLEKVWVGEWHEGWMRKVKGLRGSLGAGFKVHLPVSEQALQAVEDRGPCEVLAYNEG